MVGLALAVSILSLLALDSETPSVLLTCSTVEFFSSLCKVSFGFTSFLGSSSEILGSLLALTPVRAAFFFFVEVFL